MSHCTKYKKELFANEKGAAMVEGAVLAPIFILIFFGMMYLFNTHEASLGAGNKARNCAWHYSQKNCKDLPPECKEETNLQPTSNQLAGPQNQLGQSTGSLASYEVPSELGNLSDALTPVSDLLTGAMGLDQEKIISSENLAAAPSLLGGGNHSIKRKIAILCNEETKTGMDVLKSIWSSVW